MSNEASGDLVGLLTGIVGYVLEFSVWMGGPYAVFVAWALLCALLAFCIVSPFLCILIWVARSRKARLDRIYDRHTYPGTGPHETKLTLGTGFDD